MQASNKLLAIFILLLMLGGTFGIQEVRAEEPGTLKWRYKTGKPIRYSPVIDDRGNIYVSAGKVIHALQSDGSLKWKYELPATISTPTSIGQNRKIIVGCNNGYYYGIGPNGKLEWEKKIGASSPYSTAIAKDGTIYIVAERLLALKPNEDKKSINASLNFFSLAIGQKGELYAASENDFLYSLSQSGSKKWKYWSRSRAQHYPAIGKDGTIYIGSYDKYGSIYAIQKDGTLKWKKEVSGRKKSGSAIGPYNNIYFGSGVLYSIQPNGTLEWKFRPNEDISIADTSPAIGEDGTIYIGSDGWADEGFFLYAVNRDGSLKWKYRSEIQLSSPPALGQDGTVYIGSNDPRSQDNRLYAINGKSNGLADSPWPTFGHDNRNTFRKTEVSEQTEETKLILNVKSDSGENLNAKVFINDSFKAWSWGGHYRDSGLSAGSYKILVNKEGYESKLNNVYISPGEKEEVTLSLKKKIEPPSASFTFSPDNPKAGEKVDFNYDPPSSVSAGDDFQWSFGDGTESSAKNPEHVYTEPGTYTVKLEVAGAGGARTVNTEEITVRENKSSITVNVNDNSGEGIDASIHLDDKYKGDTGSDGVFTLSNLSPGSYTIRTEKKGYNTDTASVYLTSGEQEEITITMEKKNMPPEVTFEIEPNIPEVGEKVTLDASNTSDPDGGIQWFLWKFQEQRKYGRKVSKVFSKAGKHELKLTVSDQGGETISITREVTVLPEGRTPIKIDRKYGLVIGISKYKNEMLNLKFGASDAKEFSELLTDDNIGGIPEYNLTLLRNDEATAERIEKALKEIGRKSEADDLVVIYYSGSSTQGVDHNEDEDDGSDEFLVPYDTNISSKGKISHTELSDDIIATHLSKINAKRVLLILDSCNSAEQLDLDGEKYLLLGASKENQCAWESQELEHGVFTYYLLEAMKGKADKNNDQNISLREVFNYVKPKVEEAEQELSIKDSSTPVIRGLGDKAVTFPPEEINRSPSASLSFSPKSPETNERVNFDSDSTDPDGSIESYHWTFGDGSSSTSENPAHEYSKPGTYTVKLTVTDNEGSQDETEKEIKIYNREPNPSFSYSPEKPIVKQEITFDARKSSDAESNIAKYKWDLKGDGSYDKNGAKVVHSYNEKGDYRVKLTVTDKNGATSSITKDIRVNKEPEPEVEDKYALIIGISNYKNVTDRTCTYNRFCQLSFAEKDAKSFYELMRDDRVGNIPKDHITLLLGEEATQRKKKAAFRELIDKTDANDLVVFYFSGHGAQGDDYGAREDEADDSDEFYLPYDTRVDKLFSTAIRDDIFADWMNSLSDRYVAIILDSCYSGGATKGVKGVGKPQGGDRQTVFDDLSYEGNRRALLAASREGQQALEPKELKQGLFTHYLLEAFQDKSGDINGDGKLTVEEIYEYLEPKVESFAEKKHHEQVPIKKGSLSPALITRGKEKGDEEKTPIKTGMVVGLAQGKQAAKSGNIVAVNLGKKQGVSPGDSFKAVNEYKSSVKGVTIVEKKATLKVVELSGHDRALCEVQKSILPLKVGDNVRLVQADN